MRSFLKIYSWKPRHGLNFGDHIGPLIVKRILARMGREVEAVPVLGGDNKLLAVGSVVHEARTGDHVWGSGVNGKIWLSDTMRRDGVHFHAVRGPITRRAATEAGHEVPERYGDPGLLFPLLFHDEIERKAAEILVVYRQAGLDFPRTAFIPNINDERYYLPERAELPADWLYISPSSDPVVVAACIRLVDRVVSSSLHGIVFADAYGKETTFLLSRFEPTLKYDDYFLGTEREPVVPAGTLMQAARRSNVPPMTFRAETILDSFPFRDEATAADRLITRAPLLRPGERHSPVEQGDGQGPGGSIFVQGWAVPADGSVWSVGREAELLFEVPRDAARAYTLRLLVGTLPAGHKHYEKIRILSGGKVTASFVVHRGKEAQTIDIPLPPADPATGLVQVKAVFENPSVPRDFNLGQDSRELGVWVGAFGLVEAA